MNWSFSCGGVWLNLTVRTCFWSIVTDWLMLLSSVACSMQGVCSVGIFKGNSVIFLLETKSQSRTSCSRPAQLPKCLAPHLCWCYWFYAPIIKSTSSCSKWTTINTELVQFTVLSKCPVINISIIQHHPDQTCSSHTPDTEQANTIKKDSYNVIQCSAVLWQQHQLITWHVNCSIFNISHVFCFCFRKVWGWDGNIWKMMYIYMEIAGQLKIM